MGTIKVSDLGKAYKQYPTRWSRLIEWFLPHSFKRHQLKWVLKDLSFTIQAGEAVGILGVNGAGKSTLLKMITGTTQPTAGSVHLTGRIAALLELGMGFHPDFTGRQNVYMSGQLFGLSLDEVNELMPSIEAFADIGEYIDQPVRIYSSGMQVRLAFAVATAIRPDILIVDEALSVGDAAFQRKCFQRIESYRNAGTTLLFVSHDTETVKKLCDRAIFLKSGRLHQMGEAKLVCDAYEQFLFGGNKKTVASEINNLNQIHKTSHLDPALSAESCEVVYGNGKANIESCWLTNEQGEMVNVIESGSPFFWRYTVKFNEDVNNPIFAMMIKTREGFSLYGVDSTNSTNRTRNYARGETVEVGFKLANPLAPGIYYFNCGVRDEQGEEVEFMCRRVDSALLKVCNSESSTVLSGMLEMHAEIIVSDLS